MVILGTWATAFSYFFFFFLEVIRRWYNPRNLGGLLLPTTESRPAGRPIRSRSAVAIPLGTRFEIHFPGCFQRESVKFDGDYISETHSFLNGGGRKIVRGCYCRQSPSVVERFALTVRVKRKSHPRPPYRAAGNRTTRRRVPGCRNYPHLAD